MAKVVVTVYGHDRTIDKIGFNVFGAADEAAEVYCNDVNAIELKEGSWVYANPCVRRSARICLPNCSPGTAWAFRN